MGGECKYPAGGYEADSGCRGYLNNTQIECGGKSAAAHNQISTRVLRRDGLPEGLALAFGLARHPLEAILHLLHLTLEIVDVGFSRLARGRRRFGRWCVLAQRRAERFEHR